MHDLACKIGTTKEIGTRARQCDQIWRNFAILVSILKYWATFVNLLWPFLWYWTKCSLL